MEEYEKISGANELYRFIQEGIDDIEQGRTLTKDEMLKSMEDALGE
jgi:hypothetical protein